ncbi:MAG: hypothetical protein VYB54_07455 [Pseudomonadota bacterium]|nr:hypothetical protein [Pseudomonadota bacterium]
MPRLIVLAALAAAVSACATEPVHDLPDGGAVIPPPGYILMCLDPQRWSAEDCPNDRPLR